MRILGSILLALSTAVTVRADEADYGNLQVLASGIQNHAAVPGYLPVFRTNLFFEDAPSREDLPRIFYALPRELAPRRMTTRVTTPWVSSSRRRAAEATTSFSKGASFGRSA